MTRTAFVQAALCHSPTLLVFQLVVSAQVRTDATFPAGFMDVVSIDKVGSHFRLLYDTKGRFRVHEISADEAKYKLCKVRQQAALSVLACRLDLCGQLVTQLCAM